jgi:hypothetical protein
VYSSNSGSSQARGAETLGGVDREAQHLRLLRLDVAEPPHHIGGIPEVRRREALVLEAMAEEFRGGHPAE